MPPKPKMLTEEQIKQIRESPNYGKAADALGISEKRAKAIKGAHTLDQAMKIDAPEKDKSKPGKVTKRKEEEITEVLTEASLKPEPTKPPLGVTPETPVAPKPEATKPQPSETTGPPVTPKLQPGVTPGSPPAPLSEPPLEPQLSKTPETPALVVRVETPGTPALQPPPRETALIPEEIVGKGIQVKVTLSVSTLTLYQIASTMENDLLLGDFLDKCAQDTFEVRGYSLGLVKKGV